MAYLLIRHKVKDYPVWKKVFDDFIETRRASGEKSWQVWHTHDDPNNLILLFKWDSLENARAFMIKPELQETMAKAGVVNLPEAFFIEEYERGTT